MFFATIPPHTYCVLLPNNAGVDHEGVVKEATHFRRIDVRNRLTLISYINDVFQDGVFAHILSFPALLAPVATTLLEERPLSDAISSNVILAWETLQDGTCAVRFRFTARSTLAPTKLAYFLLRFTYDCIRNFVLNDYNFDVEAQPQLKDLAYYVSEASTYGVAIYEHCERELQNAIRLSELHPPYPDEYHDRKITTWPNFDSVRPSALEVGMLISRTQALLP
ncbi:hypothetical protein ONZ51_g9417 [Trametes cubensis]|uniref:Uncharacterized protein n=1 Tax=Trametes cubensis TaxID=1111947 RepID=A0AAD7TLT8_9APHY|nr:hypothetical protein ONZ51_g9417 [Trametes cubensis]